MRTYNNILVPYDGTISTEFTIQTACQIAQMNKSHVLVVVPYFATSLNKNEQNEIRSGVKLISRQTNIDVDVLFQDGRPSATIIDVSYSQKNDLIVLGKAEMSSLERFVIGNITGRVIGYSHCDIMVVPEDRLLRWKNILVCADASKYSQIAIKNAISYAAHFNSSLTVLSIVDLTSEFYAIDPAGAQKITQNALKLVNKIATEAKNNKINVTALVKEGEAAIEILKVAKELRAEVIIMGSHERVGLGHLLMGSVAQQVTMGAECAVFILKS